MTAEEFLEKYKFEAGEHIGNRDYDKMCEFAKEFAKYHVEEALKVASSISKVHLKTYWGDMENVTEEAIVFWGIDDPQNCYSTNVKVDKDSILNAYPLENIK